VSKFEGCYSKIQNQNRSGTTEQDTVNAAISLFNQNSKTAFSLYDCWIVLRKSPKWSAPFSVTHSHSNIENDMERPEGQKSAKKRKNEGIEGLMEAIDASNIHSAKRAAAIDEISEHMIMSTNTDDMSPNRKEYFALKRRAILKKLRENTKEIE
jgi:hypothetical protein